MKQSTYYNGAVSLFIVVFTTLLVGIITLSFVKIMTKDQHRATQADLSQSAYDSAMAGVEDAKRAVAKYIKNCVLTASTSEVCQKYRQALDGKNCDAINLILDGQTSNPEEESTLGANADQYLNQAYTCVKIKYQTSDYLAKLSGDDDAIIIPLNGVSAVNQVIISWFTKDDAGQNQTLSLGSGLSTTTGQWLRNSAWPNNRPPILVAQYYQFSSDQNDYDRSKNNFKTLFLAPFKNGVSTGSFDKDSRSSYGVAPIYGVQCANNFNNDSYACKISLNLPSQVNQSNQNFIRLSKRYASHATFSVQLAKDGAIVDFDGTQPMVDSNGRADNLFRRVEARIQPFGGVGSGLPTPVAAVQIERGNFCKDFSVTDENSGFVFNCD